jgi:antitoxin component of MazEF toxin-antitoxin module
VTAGEPLEDARLVITPLPVPVHALDELLAQMTPENLHSEGETGPSVGDEAW